MPSAAGTFSHGSLASGPDRLQNPEVKPCWVRRSQAGARCSMLLDALCLPLMKRGCRPEKHLQRGRCRSSPGLGARVCKVELAVFALCPALRDVCSMFRRRVQQERAEASTFAFAIGVFVFAAGHQELSYEPKTWQLSVRAWLRSSCGSCLGCSAAGIIAKPAFLWTSPVSLKLAFSTETQKPVASQFNLCQSRTTSRTCSSRAATPVG